MNKDEAAKTRLREALDTNEILTAIVDWRCNGSSDAELLQTLREHVEDTVQELLEEDSECAPCRGSGGGSGENRCPHCRGSGRRHSDLLEAFGYEE